MNPLTNIKNVLKLNDRELELGIIGKKSWHDSYKDSAWIFIGGLPYDLTEGDILCVFSQYGEIVNVNLVRDHKTGKSKGFAFICFEDQRSTVLSVDNLNGIKILGRTIRVDHVAEYKVPKEYGNEDELTKKIRAEGVAPKIESSSENDVIEEQKTEKKTKTKKKKKDKKRKKKENSSSDNDSSSPKDMKQENGDGIKLEVKKERYDPEYDRAVHQSKKPKTSRARDRNSKSPNPSSSNKNWSKGGIRNRRHDSESSSDSEPDRGHQRKGSPSQYRDDRDNKQGRYSDTLSRGRDREVMMRNSDQTRDRRTDYDKRDWEKERDRDLDRSKHKEDRRDKSDGSRDWRRDEYLNRGRDRSRSRERRTNNYSEQERERNRDWDRNSSRDYGRGGQDRYYGRTDHAKDRDRYR